MARGDQQRVSDQPSMIGRHTYRRGYWYIAGDETMLVAASGTLLADRWRAYPFRIRALVQLVALGTRITTGAAGLMQLAIYPASKRTLLPEGLPVAQTGDIDVSAAANISGTVIGGSVMLPRGVYWFANVTSATTLAAQIGGNSTAAFGALVGASSQDIIASTATTVSFVRGLSSLPYGSAWPDMSKVITTENAGAQYVLGQFQVAP